MFNENKAKPWQKEALDATTKFLKKEDRCIVNMACGTGKTFVEAWLGSRMNPKTAVVFVPSLHLMSQLSKEHRRTHFLKGASTIYICCDPTILGEDYFNTKIEDVPFPVTTNRGEILKFMKKKGRKVIFCTYMSSYLLEGLKFDLGIFDEAHRTAGMVGGRFTFSLHNKNVKIKKRVFFTATPKVWRGNERKSVRNSFHSMDSDLYGSESFTFTIRKAIEQGAICGYKIAIATVTSSEVMEAISKNSINIDGSKVSLKSIAAAIAIEKECRKRNIKKIFTFHSFVKRAESFVFSETTSKFLSRYFGKNNLMFIEGNMNSEKRNSILNNFSSSEKALVSNARCLGEGVDVPVADAVAFVDSKRGKIDVVQSIGRCVRLSKGKNIGYVILPIFIKDSDKKKDLESRILESDFSSIWQTLSAMSGNDSNLYYSLQEQRKKKGERGSYDEDIIDGLKHLIEVDGEGFDIQKMKHSICCRIIDGMVDHWWENFGGLISSIKKAGRKPYLNEPYGRWLHNQKQILFNDSQWKKDSQERILRIDAFKKENLFIRFWDLVFEKNIDRVLKEKEKLGRFPKGKEKLSLFLHQYKKHYKSMKKRKDLIFQKKFERLESIGFNLENTVDKRKQKNLELLLDFKRKNGHWNFGKNKELKVIATCLRQYIKEKKPDDSRVKILEAEGFDFDTHSEYQKLLDILRKKWYRHFNRILNFERKNHRPLTKKDNSFLYQWIKNQSSTPASRTKEQNDLLKKYKLKREKFFLKRK